MYVALISISKIEMLFSRNPQLNHENDWILLKKNYQFFCTNKLNFKFISDVVKIKNNRLIKFGILYINNSTSIATFFIRLDCNQSH